MRQRIVVTLLWWLAVVPGVGAPVEPLESSRHWALVSPKRPALPSIANVAGSLSAIDHFVAARLRREGLAASAPAARETLMRRVTLDLTGLPPTLAEIDAFLADRSPDAYERVVDRLLASPRFGEHMAKRWLDGARFADTDGYSGDGPRSMWLWRDWVVQAFNRNLSYDRFTIDQLAGDLLPNPTLEERIATGFNRNHRINREPGTIPEEWRIEYVVDRVDTTATVWLGLTVVCARCHDHKYDPISQREFYELFAFFNNVPEVGNGGEGPNSPPLLWLSSPEEEAKLAELDERLAAARTELERVKTLAEVPADVLSAAREKLGAVKKDRRELLAPIPVTMVMGELEKPRETFLLERGQYDKPGARVQPGVPASLSPYPDGAPRNRLGLARWLVSGSHPLTARVRVNRYWQSYFGAGLVKTDEDFGVQGEAPTHPELLDWLATEFVHSGWDVKAMQRRIVSSATYRQSSKMNSKAVERDPENRLLARASRFRLAAEVVRDQALAVSGLLVGNIGGPSVKPYQPPGVWDGLVQGVKYVPDEGDALYRRSLYTFWRRTVPPPAMTTLDAPNRETCNTRRSRTNTPLQALLLMNEKTYVEAARSLAREMLNAGGGTADARLSHGFRRVLARPPKLPELELLRASLERYREIYQDDRDAAEELTAGVGRSSDSDLEVPEWAAYTAIASVLLNLDKTIVRE